jgi:prepilin-type N-terminal cleavage/methylation domain-containing protein
MRHDMPRRGAFTLIELLVVVAIIAVLMMLLLPAIQRVREAANKVRCGNNLKQISLAFHMYHHDYQQFPTGGWNDSAARTFASSSVPHTGMDQTWGWAYQILPYVEQEPLFKTTNDAVVRSTPIPFYFCPSRRAPMAFIGFRGELRAMIDYAGSAGTARTTRDSGQQVTGLVVRSAPVPPASAANRAAIGQPIRLSQGSIPDGTSNTVLVAEKRMNRAHIGVLQGDDDQGFVSGYDPDVIRWYSIADRVELSSGQRIYPPRPDDNDPTLPSNTSRYLGFGSSHTGSFNAAFGDQSVRQVRYSINLEAYRRILIRNDGLPINTDDL